MDITLSIVVVNYFTDRMLPRCLEAVGELHESIPTEVIVVDNGSRSRELIRPDWPNAKLIRNDANVGFAAAVNQGIRSSRGSIILLLNPDTRSTADAMVGIVQAIKADRTIGALGPRVILGDGTIQRDSCGSFERIGDVLFKQTSLVRILLFLRRCTSEEFCGCGDLIKEVDWVSGVCMAIRREALQDAGLFDERMFMYYEDVDFCRRVRAAGYRVVYHPFFQVTHLKPPGDRLDRRRMRWRHTSLFLHRRKHHGVALAALIYLFETLTYGFKLLLFFPWIMMDEGKRTLYGTLLAWYLSPANFRALLKG